MQIQDENPSNSAKSQQHLFYHIPFKKYNSNKPIKELWYNYGNIVFSSRERLVLIDAAKIPAEHSGMCCTSATCAA